jgi:hypothetical protein
MSTLINPSTALSTSPSTALSVNLTSLNLEDAQTVRLRLGGRIVAGVSGTVGSMPALVRQLLVLRPELVAADVEVTTEVGRLVVGQQESAEGGLESAECGRRSSASSAESSAEGGEVSAT